MDFVCSPLPAIAMSLVLILVTFVILRHGRRLHEKKKRYHPVAGTVLNQLINFPRLYHYMTKLAHKHKTYRVLGLFRSDVYTTDPVNVEYILKTNFANYGKGSYHYTILSDGLGEGIFAVDGEKWVHQRKVMNYELSSKGMRDLSTAVFKSNAVKLAGIFSEAANCNQAIEIQDLFMKSSLDSIVKVLLGIELDTIYGTNEEGARFSKAFDLANETTFYRYVDFSWKIKRFLNIGSEAVLKNSIKVMDQFVYKLIKSKIQTVHNSAEELPALHSSKLLELGETDLKYARDMILSLLVAAKDTTTSTLSWFLYVLCKNVHLQEKIVQEIKHVTNQKDNSSVDELAASLTDEALDGMHYLHAALNETLRLYPAVPLNARDCLSDDTWPDGYSVKKGNMVGYDIYAMGRMKFIWGDDAEEFRPERWLDENGLFQQESPFKFIAFSAGPRICLGKEFAYRQMKILSALLLRSYIFKLSDENKVPRYRTMVALPIIGGLYVQAFPRPN